MKKTVNLRTLLTIAFIGTSGFSVILSVFVFSNFLTYNFRKNIDLPHAIINNTSFLNSMLRISGIRTLLITIVVAVVISGIVSKLVSKDIKNTVELAKDMQIKEFKRPKITRIAEVNNLNENLEELDKRLNLKSQYRKEIYDQLHHQSRTPLTILKNHLEGIEDGIIEANEKEIEICMNQVDNLTFLIDDMKLMIDANKLETIININEYKFKDILRTVVNGLSQQFINKGIKLTVLNNDNYNVLIDRYKFSQVMYNLLNNAFKYTEKGGSVNVRYYAENENLIIKIEDDGIGINENDIKYIFDAYYRSDSIKGIKGEGIGLYLVKEYLKLMNGSINVDSTIGIGSTFEVSIPLSIK